MAKKATNDTSRASLDYVSPDRLSFDPTNPRFAGLGGSDQDTIQALLERVPHLALDLVSSFLENGFIDYEPLVVKAVGHSRYIVVEGNRRLAAIRHILADKDKYAHKSDKLDDLKSIPVLIFAKSPSVQLKKEQRVYLGVRHLFGFREWPPESKAHYLHSHVRSEEDLQRLTRELNIKRQDIQRYLVPHRLRAKASALWRPYKDQDFWVLGESLNRSGIKSYIALDIDRESLEVRGFDRKKFAFLLRFVYGSPEKRRADRVVKETRQLSSLASVLKNRKATAALEQGVSLSEASVLLESPDESRTRLREMLRESKALTDRLRREPNAAKMITAFKVFAKEARRFLTHGR